MRKNFLIGFVMLIVSIPTFAGDYLTNTNQNAAFLRMIARGASIDIDGVYSNSWQSPDERIYYFGNIEKKANNKILVRYSGHGNKNTYFDDVKGKIIWESPQGWMLCE